jgi:hypothetical protein
MVNRRNNLVSYAKTWVLLDMLALVAVTIGWPFLDEA